MKYPFNSVEEFKDLGMYKPVPGPYGTPPAITHRMNTPISHKENFKLFLERKTPVWAIDLLTMFQTIQPECMPDAYARNHGGIDWFGIEWQYEPNSQAAMVKPGTRRLSDIANWEKELDWPDLSVIDWEKDYVENYRDILSPDRPINFIIVNGLFERTADLTNFSDTLVYLLIDPESMNAFYLKLRDFIVDLMKIAKDVYGADMITMHDDLGSQRAPFMSPETYHSVLLPHHKYIVEKGHEMGLAMNFHSCGCVEPLLPYFIEAGWDVWEGQLSSNNMDELIEKYGQEIGFTSLYLPNPTDAEETIKAEIDKRLYQWGKDGRYMFWMALMPESYRKWQDYVYENSRKLFLER